MSSSSWGQSGNFPCVNNHVVAHAAVSPAGMGSPKGDGRQAVYADGAYSSRPRRGLFAVLAAPARAAGPDHKVWLRAGQAMMCWGLGRYGDFKAGRL